MSSGWLSWFTWNTSEGLKGQQQVMMQIPKKMVSDNVSVNLDKVEEQLMDVYRITMQSIDLILEQNQVTAELMEQSDQLLLFSKQYSENQKKLAKQNEQTVFAQKVTQFVDRVHEMTSDFQKEQLLDKVQEDSKRIEQLQIQLADIPPPDPENDPKNNIVVNEDALSSHLNDLFAYYSNELIPLLESRGETLVELMEMSEQLLIESEKYRNSARELNIALTGSGNIYWIFLIDVIAGLLSLINTTRETKTAVITANSGRLLLSLAIVISVLVMRFSKIQTGLIFGTAYILLTWLFSVINTIIETYKTFRNYNTFQLIYYALTVLYTLFITYFGVKTYVTHKILFKGGHLISPGYIVGVGLFGVVLAASKLYMTWYGIVTPSDVQGPFTEDLQQPLTNITDEKVSEIEVAGNDDQMSIPAEDDDSGVVEPEEEMNL